MHWRSKLIHSDAAAPAGFRGLAQPTHRASTVVFPTLADALRDPHGVDGGYSYGLHGTPTVLELAARIAELEGAARTLIVPSGLGAIALVYMALCRAGSHVLIPDSAYAPNRELAHGLLARFGVVGETYDPLIAGGIGVAAFFCFMFSWVELLLARTLTAVNAKPIAAIMTRTISASGMDWGVLAAAGVLTIIPGALVIWFVRNYIAKGFALGRV